jgi:anaerobic C4-dicarboxylate transporter
LVCLFPGLIAGIVVCILIGIGVGVAVFFFKMRNKVSGYDIIQ